MVWGRWSFSLADADFADATVALADDSGVVKTEILARDPGAGDPGIVWAVAGDTNSTLLPAPKSGDRCYRVTVRGVRIDGEAQPHYEYPVCLIDPNASTGLSVTVESATPDGVGSTFEVAITFSESVDGFTRNDIDVFNGTVAAFSGSGSRYDVSIRADDNGAIVVTVGSGAVHDTDNRPNTPAAPLVRTADVGRPMVSITSSSRSVVSGSFDVTITFNEPVTGLDLSDIRVVNGSATNLSGSGRSFRATISPDSDGTVMVRILQDAAIAASGRANAVSPPFTRLSSTSSSPAGIGFDTWDRASVLRLHATEFDREEPDKGYTGNVTSCEAGATDDEFRESVLRRLNWYRATAGLADVSEGAMLTRTAQQRALEYLANGTFSVSANAQCVSGETASANDHSIGWLGSAGFTVIDSMIESSGNHTLRRTLLTPHLREVGLGNARSAEHTYRVSHATVASYGDAWNASRPRVREERQFVAWPPAGYVAEDLVPQKWSFSLSNADYSDALVSVSDHVSPLPVSLLGTEGWYREETLEWSVDTADAAVRNRGPTDADHCFTVRISGVRVGSTLQNPYEYAVCTVDTAQ